MSLLESFSYDPKALIIAPQWAQLIANGEKTWEMRSQAVKHRGYFAIAEKGTGRLIAMANLRECNGPHSINYLIQHEQRHCGTREAIVAPGFKYWFSWELDNVYRFNNPVSYQPKSGAVSWVKLSADVVEKIVEEMKDSQQVIEVSKMESAFDSESLLTRRAPTEVIGQKSSEQAPKAVAPLMTSNLEGAASATDVSRPENGSTVLKVPRAKDGTTFDRKSCLRNGIYRVGEKGNEKTFKNYVDALKYLKEMKTAVWHRPNSNGNWGGVRAVEWISVAE